MEAQTTLRPMLAHGRCGVAVPLVCRARKFRSAGILRGIWAPVVLLLVLASSAWSACAAELRIGNAHGYPGDTVELTLSLQGDGATVSADFLIARGYVANFASPPATPLAPGATCTIEDQGLRVVWNGSANTDLVDICVLRMTIFGQDPRFNQSIFGNPQHCLDAGHVEQPCSIDNGYIDVVYEIERSFIAVLNDPPAAPSLQEVVDFDYADTTATPPVQFVDAVRPEYVRASNLQWTAEYGPWLLENPQSPITRLDQRGARFTFTTLEQREQALVAARNDPAVREIVESLSLIGPEQTYPVLPRENQPFGLYLVGFSCPRIDIATPVSRSIEVVGSQIEIVLESYPPDQLCFGVLLPGYSGAIVEVPALPAGTYNVGIQTAAGHWNMELVVYPSSSATTAPSQIPNPDVKYWLILGVVILAVWRFSTQKT